MRRGGLEVAQVLRRFLGGYRQRYGGLGRDQARVVSALTACRTAELGGHVDACDACGFQRISYNSCGNRHCPKCHASATAGWLERERAYLLPVPYAHVVFTLPHLLAPLALQNPRIFYGLLFRAAAKTLLEIAADPKHLGGLIGFVAILHTWGQSLIHHPHLHCLVPAGGLAPGEGRWISCRAGFFLPVRVLGALFRGKYLALLEQSFRRGQLVFHGQLRGVADPTAFGRLLKQARRKKWVVYAKPPFAGPEPVLKYLARYTHRIALSNDLLLGIDETAVTFTWKDYRHGARSEPMRLDPVEFVRRFLLHALPRGFVRIRRYGILSNAQRQQRLTRCRELLGLDEGSPTSSDATPSESLDHEPQERNGASARGIVCDACQQGRMRTLEWILPLHHPAARAPPVRCLP